MKINLISIILWFSIVNATFGNHTPVFTLTGDSEDTTIPIEFLSIYKDTTNLEFEAIKQLDESIFQNGNVNFIHHPQTVCWVKFKLQNTSSTIDNWYLELPNWAISYVDLYFENTEGDYEHFTVGALRKASLKKVEHKNYLFNLPDLEKEKQVFLRLQSNHPFPLQFWVRSNNLVVNYSTKEYAMLGIFYGVLGSLAIFNLLMFLWQRKPLNLFYVIYVLTCMTLCTSEDGLGFQHIWSSFPKVNSFLHENITQIYVVALILYLNTFLQLNKTQPFLFRSIIGVAITCFFYSRYTSGLGFNENLGIYTPVILLFMVAAYRTKNNNYIPTTWLLMALLASLTGLIILTLRIKGYIDFGNKTRAQLIMIVYAMNIAFVFESILFAIAIVKRMKLADINSKKSVEYSEIRFRKIFESSFDASIFYSTCQRKIIDVNDKACSLFATTKSNLISSNILELINLNGSEMAPYQQLLTEKKKEIANDLISFETSGVTSNSEVFDCEVSFSPIKHGKEKFIIINIKDVSIRKASERKLADQMHTIQNKNVQLEQYINSNSELESFAYVASHDIKQPLRTIKSFSKVLEQHLSKNEIIDKNSAQYLEFIQSSVENLERLTTDILEHSRISSIKSSKFESENLNDILTIIQQNLNQLIFENNVLIQTDNLPDNIILVKTKVIQLFQNIISNAIKFRKINEQCIIKVRGTETPECWQFEIQDNGIGIEKENFETIFQVFSKLHSASEYRGSGIGLATCKKIIDLHEGKIWVESEFGVGTTFYFTISKDIAMANLETEKQSNFDTIFV